MSNTIKIYQDKQQKIIKSLNKLYDFIHKGNAFGLTLPKEMYIKLENAIKSVQDDKLKIALIGGFSEGKTSIAAAWLGKLDKSSMKISAAESSNEVKVYEIDDECVLIDTPGLYGYKEKENNCYEIEKYKDITKKYVSEAHIILYVMNSKNPIKESHKDDLIWLFRELNLLSRTVFVLSRFDEVADVEDEQEYQHYLKIKQENVQNRLKDFLSLSSQEMGELVIVGVAANPFEEGVEYWLENPQEFEQLSHIGTLQAATKEIIANQGGLSEIVNEAKKSIFNDIFYQEIPKIEQKNKELVHILQELEHLYQMQNGDLNRLLMQINSARNNIKTQLNGYMGDLLVQVNGLGLETAKNFFDREVGQDACVIQSTINQIFLNETVSISSTINHQKIQFNAKLNDIDSVASQLMRQGVEHLVKNVKFDNTTILAARDGISAGAKMIGFDMSKVLKFKPYGAIKLAEKLNGALAALGLIMEAYDSIKKAQLEADFKEMIEAFKSDIQNQQKEMLAMLDDEKKFVSAFFQGYIELSNKVNSLKNQMENQYNLQQDFNEWKRQGDIIEGEFREII